MKRAKANAKAKTITKGESSKRNAASVKVPKLNVPVEELCIGAASRRPIAPPRTLIVAASQTSASEVQRRRSSAARCAQDASDRAAGLDCRPHD